MDHADLRLFPGHTGQHDRPGRDAVDEIRGSINRIDDPVEPAVADLVRMFFPKDAVRWPGFFYSVPQKRLDIPIGLANPILMTFSINLESRPFGKV